MKYNLRVALPESESMEDLIEEIKEDYEEIDCNVKGEKKIPEGKSNGLGFAPSTAIMLFELAIGIASGAEASKKLYESLKRKIKDKNGKIKVSYDDVEDLVYEILEQSCGVKPNEADLILRKSKEKYYLFKFECEDGKKHLIKLYKNEPDFEYKQLENSQC